MAERQIRPQPGPQEQALSSPADVLILGGAAGVGKTFSLLLEPLRYQHVPGFSAVIFRRESPQITNPGGLWDEAGTLYPLLGAEPKITTLEWVFPGKRAKVKFAHMEKEQDRTSWDGSQIPLIGFDQLEHFAEIQFWYMFSRNRSACGVRPYIRATCNPVPEDDPVGGWLAKLLAWWIDAETGYPIWERSGVIRWFVRLNNVVEWADSAEELIARHPELSSDEMRPKSFTFIPGRLEHNAILMQKDPGYRANLLALPYVERERLLGGNWKVRPAAGKVFNRAWFEIVSAAPRECVWVRGWDKAGTEGAGDYSAGVKVGKDSHGIFYIADVAHGQWTSLQRNRVMLQKAEADGVDCEIEIEQEPGSAGKESAETSVRALAGYVVRARTSSGDKTHRALPVSAQAEAGNVKLVRGDWNERFLSELHNFPDGKFDDQVDGLSLAFNRLSLRPAPFALVGGMDELTAVEQAALERDRVEVAASVIDEAIRTQGVYWPGGSVH